jgi:hypothetical protein
VGGGGSLRLRRVTDERDGELVPRMYSYWSSAWMGATCTYVFVGHADNHPRFFQVDRATGAVMRFGSLIPYAGTGEGWYWSLDGEVYLCDGPRLRRFNPFTGEDVIVFDISDSHPGCRLWQAHSSADGETHSATVERITSDGPYVRVGTVVFWKGRQDFYPAHGVLDESQITPDGAFLIIKEDDDNRIINLFTRETRLLRDEARAIGHSDCGPGFVVGEADKPDPGACVMWDLRGPLTQERCRILFQTLNMGHVSVRGTTCLLSDQTHISLVPLDGSGVRPLIEHGMVGSDYDHQVQANLDPTGRVACYMTNQGGGRLDVFLLDIPVS